MQIVGKDCPTCRKSLYDFEKSNLDLLKLLTSNIDPEPIVPDDPKPTLPALANPEPKKAGSIYSRNEEKYWDCFKCHTVNKTYYGGKFSPCSNCKKPTH